MSAIIVRMQIAEVNNLQNVEHGKIRFACNLQKNIFGQTSDILGIYGQNGSGKTAFIHAVDLLRAVLSGETLQNDALTYIMQGQEVATLSFTFTVSGFIKPYRVVYDFEVTRIKATSTDLVGGKTDRVCVLREKIRYSTFDTDKWSKLATVFDCDMRSNTLFTPVKSKKSLMDKNKNVDFLTDLRVAKKLAISRGTSFVFSDEMQKLLRGEIMSPFQEISTALHEYGMHDLYVIGTRGWGPINLNLGLPFYFKVKKEHHISMGSFLFRLDNPTFLPNMLFPIIKEAIDILCTVLYTIVPGLKIELQLIGKQLADDGTEGVMVELVSVRNNKKIPLRFESEGIKKLVAILNMLIATYNNPSMTLAIDELDAGIFEYLLGELLKIFNNSGQGQLIFTSHNLRPLETLSKHSIIFTTTNAKERYIRLVNVKSNNNLRDYYYHDIVLGGQREDIYDTTNNFEIEFAMKKAGVLNG